MMKEKGLAVCGVGDAELSIFLPILRERLGSSDGGGVRSLAVTRALLSRLTSGVWWETEGVRFTGLVSKEGSQRMILAIEQDNCRPGGRIYGGGFFPGGRSVGFVGCDPIDYLASLRKLPGFSWPRMFDAFESDVWEAEEIGSEARRTVIDLWAEVVGQFWLVERLNQEGLPVIFVAGGSAGKYFDDLVLGGKMMDLRWNRVGGEMSRRWKILRGELGKLGKTRGEWHSWMRKTD